MSSSARPARSRAHSPRRALHLAAESAAGPHVAAGPLAGPHGAAGSLFLDDLNDAGGPVTAASTAAAPTGSTHIVAPGPLAGPPAAAGPLAPAAPPDGTHAGAAEPIAEARTDIHIVGHGARDVHPWFASVTRSMPNPSTPASATTDTFPITLDMGHAAQDETTRSTPAVIGSAASL